MQGGSESILANFQTELDSITTHGSSAACWLEGNGEPMLFASGHVEHKEVDTETTIFSAASISKLIIGTAVMQCVEDDLMQLEGPVSSYLPGDCAVYNPFYDGHVITIEMLLRHTSSLQDNEEQLCQGSRYRVDGGGAMPMHALPGYALSVQTPAMGAEALARRLRTGPAPVVGRIERDRVLLDLRTVNDGELDALSAALRRALAPG